MTDAMIPAVLTGIAGIVTSIASAYAIIVKANRKTEETARGTNARLEVNAERLEANTATTMETKQQLDEVHVLVNGNMSALQAELRVAKAENARLREALARQGQVQGQVQGQGSGG